MRGIVKLFVSRTSAAVHNYRVEDKASSLPESRERQIIEFKSRRGRKAFTDFLATANVIQTLFGPQHTLWIIKINTYTPQIPVPVFLNQNKRNYDLQGQESWRLSTKKQRLEMKL